MRKISLLLVLMAGLLVPAINAQMFDVLNRTSPDIAYSQASTLTKQNATNFALEAVVTVTTPAATTFTATPGTDVVTGTVFSQAASGLVVRLTTTTTLPAGLATSTDYYVIKMADGTNKLASSLQNALAGTPIDITDAGTGTHTATPTALSGGAIKVQASLDCINYADVTSSSTNVTATGNLLWLYTGQAHRCVRVFTTLTTGQLKVYALYSEPKK